MPGYFNSRSNVLTPQEVARSLAVTYCLLLDLLDVIATVDKLLVDFTNNGQENFIHLTLVLSLVVLVPYRSPVDYQ